MMYTKTVLTVGITLYSTRIILNELGACDYGIFNVVAGVISMLSFLTSASASSIRRYLSNAMGKNDEQLVAIIFQEGCRIHLCLSFLVVVIFEILGIFLFDSFLNIETSRVNAAYFIFHCTLFSTFFSILAIPYTAAINSHEEIYIISIVYIIEAFAKLGIALLLKILPYGKLEIYGFLLAMIYSIDTIALIIYCHTHYKEAKAKKVLNKEIRTELLKFSSWTSLGNLSRIFSYQGSVVLVNLFAGTIANAAYAIATQVNSQMNYFSSSLLQAIDPQIMKSAGAGDMNRMYRLSVSACKFSFFLITFFSIPILLRMQYVLKIWLINVPKFTCTFCWVILLTTSIGQITMGLQSAIYAKGNIKDYQQIISIIQILAIPCSYLFLINGCPVSVVVYALLFVELVILVFRIYYVYYYVGISVLSLIFSDFLPLLFSVIVSYGVLVLINVFICETFEGFILICLLSFIVYFTCFWVMALSKFERELLKSLFDRIKHKFISLSIYIH